MKGGNKPQIFPVIILGVVATPTIIFRLSREMKIKHLIRPKNITYHLDKNNLIICGLCVTFFIILTSLVVTGRLTEIDEKILVWIHEQLPSWFIYIAKASYFVGEAEVAVFLVLFSLIFLVWKKYWIEAQVMAVSCLSILILIDRIFKPLFAIPRPFDRLVENAFGYSYPSGHAAGNLLLYFLLCYFISQSFPRWKNTLYSIAIFLLILMGVSSAYLRVHWVTDIIASYGVGYVMFSIALLLLRSSNPRQT